MMSSDAIALADLFAWSRDDILDAVSRLLLSLILGIAVSGFYAYSARRRPEAMALGGTLVLLSVLITMVTMAVGENTAVAFTLVGTLAIVRFRTTVRDIRDTAFVIFAVAVGLAIGAGNPLVAVVGAVIVGFSSMVIARLGGDAPMDDAPVPGRLSMRLEGPGPHQGPVEALLKDRVRQFRLLEVRLDGRGNTRMAYEVDGAAEDGAGLVAALDSVDGVLRASLSFGAPEDI